MNALRPDHIKIYPRPSQGIYRIKISAVTNEKHYYLPAISIEARKYFPERLIQFHEESNIEDCIGSITIPTEFDLEEGDIVTVNSAGTLRVILHRNANSNTLLVTERCDNLCLFCSQPPKTEADQWLFNEAFMAISDFGSSELVGISGGEPLLDRKSFLKLLASLSNTGNKTALHVLTNGRAFSNREFAQQVSTLAHGRDIAFGIPLYSYKSEIHDKLVGASGAWTETVEGLLHAASMNLRVELRIIPTAQNIDDVSGLISLLARVFPSIEQVSIMNLEPHGYARKNWNSLYISPSHYAKQLIDWCELAKTLSLPLALFNYTFCEIPVETRLFTVKSISDWKNTYLEECEGCKLRSECCGVFTSAKHKFQPTVSAIL